MGQVRQARPGAGVGSRCESGPDPTYPGPWISLCGSAKGYLRQNHSENKRSLPQRGTKEPDAGWAHQIKPQQVPGSSGPPSGQHRWAHGGKAAVFSQVQVHTKKTLEKPAERRPRRGSGEPQVGPGCTALGTKVHQWLRWLGSSYLFPRK